MLGAGLLLLLSDVDGLYDGDPSTGYTLTVLDRVDDVGAMEPRQRGSAGSGLGRGGMASKLEAARMATLSAAHTVIANARRPGVVADVAEGGAVGTWFPPQARRPDSRKLWLALARTPRGTLVVDSGAVQALRKQGSSLLAAGIAKVSGEFEAGDLVDIVGPDELTVGRGLVAYDSQELTRVQGRSTGELVTKLGAGYERAVVHRDSMLVLAS
jgi:glutamate 5-kinase